MGKFGRNFCNKTRAREVLQCRNRFYVKKLFVNIEYTIMTGISGMNLVNGINNLAINFD